MKICSFGTPLLMPSIRINTVTCDYGGFAASTPSRCNQFAVCKGLMSYFVLDYISAISISDRSITKIFSNIETVAADKKKKRKTKLHGLSHSRPTTSQKIW
jgi:hypothetical protein